jgi:ribonuclease HI
VHQIRRKGCGVGAVLVSPPGAHIPIAVKLKFDCPNNVAEYEPCVTGLKAAVYMGIEELYVFGDSSLVISQTIGKWDIKDAKFLPYHGDFEALAKKLKRITFAYMSRTKKHFADAKATLASMIEIPEGIYDRDWAKR